MNFARSIAVAAAASFACGAASANITYVVDHTYGSGSVIGTITTDGTLGPLSPSTPDNFVSWNLTISDGTNSETLTPLNSLENNTANPSVFATATDLLFNFSGTPAIFYFTDNTTNSSVCWSSNGTSGCNVSGDTTAGASIIVGGATGTAQIAALSGEAYVIGVASVPEAAAWALMLAGFGGLGVALRRRRLLAA